MGWLRMLPKSKWLGILILLIINPVFAQSFSVSPDYIVDTINLSVTTYLTKTIEIENLLNTTITVDITTQSTNVEITVDQVDVEAYDTAPITIIISPNQEKLINTEIEVSRGSETKEIPIIVSVVKPEETKKELLISVFPSGITTSLVRGTAREEIIQIQNVGDEDLDLSATVSGGIALSDGTISPAYIKEFLSGILKPGEKRTMTLGLVGKNVEPGTYTNKILLQYAPGEIIQIPIQLTILKSPTPTENRTLHIITFPEDNYKVGDILYISTVDDSGNPVQSSINIVQNDVEGNKIKEFKYTIPFKLDPGIYTITATLEGYNTVEKIIEMEELDSSLSIIPNNPTTQDDITITYQTLGGQLMDNAEIIVDNSTYKDSQIVITLQEGTHTIKAKAPGYKEQIKTITVKKKIEVVIPKPILESGETQIIKFSRSVSYKIERLEDGQAVTVDYGTGDLYTFDEKEPGVYNIIVDNEVVGTVTVEESNVVYLDIIYEYWWVLGGVVVLAILYIHNRKGFKYPKVGREKYRIRDVRQVRGALGEKVEEK